MRRVVTPGKTSLLGWFVALVVLLCLAETGTAAMQCNSCHGTSNPIDGRPLDAPARDPQTGGFQGNHRTHLPGVVTPSSCTPCHPGSGGYATRHRDGKIKLGANINASPLGATYNAVVRFFVHSADDRESVILAVIFQGA